MEADWADGGIGLKVGGFVPEKQPSRHGGSGDARNKGGAAAAASSRRAPKKPSSELAEWAGPGASLGGAGGGAVRDGRESSFTWSL